MDTSPGVGPIRNLACHAILNQQPVSCPELADDPPPTTGSWQKALDLIEHRKDNLL